MEINPSSIFQGSIMSYIKCILLLPLLFFNIISSAKQTYSGKITGANGIPLQGATVSVRDLKTSVNTGSDGQFNILCRKDESLEISSIGYETKKVGLPEFTILNISLALFTINLIRFADILLWTAEVEIELGDLDKARQYVNLVRQRAENPAGWVKNSTGPFAPYAANYKINAYPPGSWSDKDSARKAVRYERMLELAMEGHRFFDLVRWGIADQEINNYLLKEKTFRSYLNNVQFKKGVHEYFPIPQTQIDLSAPSNGIPLLKQNNGY